MASAASRDPRGRPAKRVQVPLEKVEVVRSTQARVRMSPEREQELLEVLGAGRQFTDDPELYFDGDRYWVGDGFHRLGAYGKAGRLKVWAYVREGTLRDALIHAAGANAEHGLPRTRRDLRRALSLLLSDDDLRPLSDRTLAALAHTTDKTVAAVRRDLGVGGGTRVRTDRHGNTSEMDVSNIGPRRRAAALDPGPVNAFHELPAAARAALKEVLRVASGLGKGQYAFLRTWLSDQLPPKAKEAADLLTQLELEEAGPGGDAGGGEEDLRF
jgi:hypothetical protein